MSRKKPAKKPIKTGRRTVVTPERTKKLCAHLGRGVPAKTACLLAGMSYSVYMKTRRSGRDGDSPEAIAFLQATDEARAVHEAKLIQIINMAMSDPKVGPEHAKWMLERRYWRRWNPRGRTELTGKNGAPLIPADTDFSSMTDAELQAIAAGGAVGVSRKG